MCVTLVQWSSSCLNVQINRFRLPATLFSVSLYRFFFFFLSVWSLFFNTGFPFGLFFFILTGDPAGHALGSIYIKALDLHTGEAYDQKKTIKLSRHVPPLKQLNFFQC